ncbi:hypothetical protein HMPREF1556_00924 [Porphyromonas sp. oral taxon 278 str. W7784]|jgi:hypothetical protein|uniref:hypothetical protein n=1 Tax=Porphyromonas sp. oral taxon 278 TaxID=712437 RepID=UPI0003ACE2D4|nr:hypothetical protein [Porphyromonas sp. oral taxon 278]ERJ72097.1 hypothetical protein HMPREF1556_00924 [Porphyromonas sp. oral taxon 278 str. W7784]
MAKTNAESKITKPIEETLWKSANRLCGAIESSEYKRVEPSKADPSLMNYAPPYFLCKRYEEQVRKLYNFQDNLERQLSCLERM